MATNHYQLVFSLYAHPILGVLIEPFLVHKNASGSLSLRYQKVSSENVRDFYPQISAHELELIHSLSVISNQGLASILNTTIPNLEATLQKLSAASDNKSKLLFQQVTEKVAQVKHDFFPRLQPNDLVFETGKDGYPAYHQLHYKPEISFQFHFDFQDDALVVEPEFSKKELNGKPVAILDENTQIALIGSTLIPIPKVVSPKRLKPFGEKKQIQVENRYLKTYTEKIVLPDLINGTGSVKGNILKKEVGLEGIELHFSFSFVGAQLGLFSNVKSGSLQLPEFLSIEARFHYGNHKTGVQSLWQNEWKIVEESPMVLQQLVRDHEAEKQWIKSMEDSLGVIFKKGSAICTFIQLRDEILPALESLTPSVSTTFSSEFNQLVLKPAKVRLQLLDRIDYFKVEGVAEWQGISLDLATLRKKFTDNSALIKNGDQFLMLSAEDQEFLTQFFSVAQGSKDLILPRKTVYAVKQTHEAVFNRKWEQFTSLLQPDESKEFDVQSLSPNIELREYQVKGIEWLIRLSAFGVGGILADDMGLGKTFQATAFLKYQLQQQSQQPVLIIVPSTLIFNWQHELKRFSHEFRVLVHAGPNRAKSLKSMSKFYNVWLMSYQTLVRDLSLIKDLRFSTVIVDEAHQLKNPSTVSYKAVSSLKSDNLFLLTGTPLQNSPLDLWALSELANPELLSQKIRPQSLQKVESSDNYVGRLKLLRALVQPFMLRRTKQNVLKDLPPKTVSFVYCNMSEEQEKEYLEYNQLLQDDFQALTKGATVGTRNVKILRALTVLRLLSNHPKLIDSQTKNTSGKFDLVVEKLHEVLSEGHKVLIFSSFVKHLQVYAEYLKTENIPFSFLTGQTKDKEREKEVLKFRENEEVQVFLISLKAGGVGLNLVEASYVFLLDPWWNPAAELQAMDRVYRIGQKNPVSVFKFITTNSVEEKIIQLQERKQLLTDQVIDDQNIDQPAFTIDALREILFSKI